MRFPTRNSRARRLKQSSACQPSNRQDELPRDCSWSKRCRFTVCQTRLLRDASRVAAATAADVRRVAQQFLRPDRLAIVVAGDLQSIESSIRAAESAPIVRMTLDDVFAPPR